MVETISERHQSGALESPAEGPRLQCAPREVEELECVTINLVQFDDKRHVCREYTK